MSDPLWQPSPLHIADSNLIEFMRRIDAEHATSIVDYAGLHAFSIAEMAKFWSALWDYAGVIGDRGSDRVITDAPTIRDVKFFPDATLNFAENLLRRRDDADAIVFRGEDRVRRTLSHAELYVQVAKASAALADLGVGPGDRVAAWLPNMPETYVLMLAAASIGAVFTSTSPDFGVSGVLDRFGQIEPRVLVVADGYYYSGRERDCLKRAAEIAHGLASVERTIVVAYVNETPDISAIPDAVSWTEAVAARSESEVEFERLPFDHPLYVLYSSGTTGPPKCIVHRAGGILIKHLEEHKLQCDVRPGDRVFYFTTAGWMMWNWLASALASEATLIVYDGSPFQPGPQAMFDMADECKITLFGTSAKFIDAIAKSGMRPADSHDLSSIRTICSTGSPLAHESFDFVYAAIKRDVHLASICGGTDLCGSLIAGDPTSPVWRGEIQRPALGVAVDVFDEDAGPLGFDKGELVCTEAFPSMPLGFWNDPDGEKYRKAYFEKFPNVWRQGDFVSWTCHGGLVVYGRSDATLNPGGVRIGTSEIYRQVEQLEEVIEALVIGQEWGSDTRVVLFVRLVDPIDLDDDLRAKIRRHIRVNSTPRHVPAVIVAVDDIPRTKSGKISELAVTAVVHGREVSNAEALANPEALDHFAKLVELA